MLAGLNAKPSGAPLAARPPQRPIGHRLVPPAAHRHVEAQRVRKFDGVDDVSSRAAAARDQRRPLVHQPVVDLPRLLVAGIGPPQQRPCERVRNFGDRIFN